MNAVELIVRQAADRPNAAALWLPDGGVTTFGDLGRLASGVRSRMQKLGVGPGDTVLLGAARGISPGTPVKVSAPTDVKKP